MAANGPGGIGAEDETLSSSSEDDPAEDQSQEQKQITNLSRRLPKLLSIFNLHRIIGEGSYSSVYLASLKCDSDLTDDQKKFFAIKHLIPISHPDRIEHELKCLKYIGGCDNVVGVELCLRHVDAVVFIMPYLPHTKFSEYFYNMDVLEIRLYMKNLLLALRRVHQFNIIHRDVKPSNFLYNRDTKKYLLVDFGLAQTVYFEPPPIKITVEENKVNNRNLNHVSNSISKNVTTATKRKFNETTYDKNADSTNPKAKRIAIEPPYPNHDSLTKRNISHYPSNINRRITETKKLQAVRRQVLADNRNGMDAKKPTIKFMPANQAAHMKCNGNFKQKTIGDEDCRCSGLPAVCSICLNRQPYKASRSGTQGFRPPEVLLKYPDQTTAVDIWASGVILLSFLSGRYPFFRGTDDLTALAEHVTIFGSLPIKRVAQILGRHLMCSYKKHPIDLKKLCKYLRTRDACLNKISNKLNDSNKETTDVNIKQTEQTRVSSNYKNTALKDGCENDNPVVNSDIKILESQNALPSDCNSNLNHKSDRLELNSNKKPDRCCDDCALPTVSCICLGLGNDSYSINNRITIDNKNHLEFPDEAYDLLVKLLDVNPHTRITASEALNHPFLVDL